MSNSIYAMLSRQTGLMNEMQVVANNIANLSTTGFRSENVIFSEHLHRLDGRRDGLSQAHAGAHMTELSQGGIRQTGGMLDLAIEGPGFFQIETADGLRLTRGGAFFATAQGDVATAQGHRLLDAGGAPVFVPLDATTISIAADGTMTADGNPIAQIGVVDVETVAELTREDGVMFRPDGAVIPVEFPKVMQGFLEDSNVNPVHEIARMIEVQRGYEMGQTFLEHEDERLQSMMRLVGR